MKFEIQLSDEAEEDIFKSFVWNEKKQSGLGDEFFDVIQNSFQLISKSPESYRIQYKQKVRAFVVDRFPFLFYI